MAKFTAGAAVVHVTPNLDGFHNKIKSTLKTVQDKVRVAVDVDTGAAKAEMAELTRKRKATVEVNVRGTAGLKALTQSVKAINKASGPAAGAVTRLAKGTSLVGAVAALAAPALGLIATAALGIPGAMAVAGASIGAIALGMDGIKRAAEVAKPALDKLKASVSATFEQGMIPVFQKIADVFLPGITNGMNGVARGVVAVAQGFTQVITSGNQLDAINEILSNTRQFLMGIVPFVQSTTRGFITLAAVGSNSLVKFTEILNQFGAKFEEMTNRLRESGVLDKAFTQLGVTVQIVLDLFLRLMEAGVGIMARLGPSFNNFLRVVGDALIALLPFFESFARVIFDAGAAIIQWMLPGLRWLAPILGPIAAVIAMVSGAFLFFKGIMMLLGPVIKIVTVAFRLLSLAFALSPIGVVIVAIIALIGIFVLLWQRCEWFRNFWYMVWDGIVSAAMWAWNTILKPVFDGIMAAVRAVGGFFVWLWQAVIVPAWNGIVAAFQWAWNVIIKPVFDAISFAIRLLAAILFTVLVTPFIIAWNLMSAAVQWAWNNIIKPTWDALAAAAQWLWNTVLAPVFGFIGAAWNALCAGIRWVFDNVLNPAWNAVATAAQWLWNNVLRPVFDFIGRAWAALLDGINWYWNNVLKPAWNAVQAAAQWMWNNVLRVVFAAIGNAWRALLDGINWVWNNILKPCWNALQAAARWLWNNVLKPVFKFIGDGWRGLMNGIRWVYDNILKPCFDAVKSAVDAVGQTFQRVADWIGKAWNAIKEHAAKPIRFVVNTVINDGLIAGWNWIESKLGLNMHVNKIRLPFAEGGPVPETRFARGGRVPGMGNRDSVPAMLMPGEYVISKKVVKQWGMDNIHSAHQAARNGDRTPFAKGGPVQHFANGGQVLDPRTMIGILRGFNFPGFTVTDTFRPGANDWHGRGHAVDFVTANMVRASHILANAYPNSTELIHTPGANLHNGKPHRYGAATRAGHWDHIHWAMAGMEPGGGGGNGGGGFFGWLISQFKRIFIDPVFNAIPGAPPEWLDIPKKTAIKAKDKVFEKLYAWLGANGGGASVAGTKAAGQWMPQVLQALNMLGMPASWADETIAQIAIESGGNPNAVNNWDINAQNGNASRGLLQTIPTTFRANMYPGHGNILAPLDNILAALTYAQRRYGSIPSIWPTRAGYAEGGPVVPLFDNGGILPTTPNGYGMYANHSGKPEAVLTNDQLKWLRSAADGRGGSGITVNNNVETRTDASPESIAQANARYTKWALRGA